MRSSMSPNVGAMPMTALVLAVLVATQTVQTQLLSVLSQFGVADQDIATIESGRAVTRVLRGTLLRKIVADKTRSSLEAALTSIKRTREAG